MTLNHIHLALITALALMILSVVTRAEARADRTTAFPVLVETTHQLSAFEP